MTTSTLLTATAASPIRKVGAIILRDTATQHPQLLLVQPLAKQAAEQAETPFVPPRGSRMFWQQNHSGETEWHDARDDHTAITHAHHLEPLEETLTRELDEEAGIPPAQLHALRARGNAVHVLGARPYKDYQIQWYILTPTAADIAAFTTAPKDTHALRWVTLLECQHMAEKGTARAGYLPVIHEALDTVRYAAGVSHTNP